MRDPAADLRAVAFNLERGLESTYKVKAYRAAAATLDGVTREELEARRDEGALTALDLGFNTTK